MLPAVFAMGVAIALQSSAPAKPAGEPWPDSRPITHLFQNLGKDLKNLASVTSLETLAAGAAATAGAHAADRRVADWAGRAGASSYTRTGDLLGVAGTQAGAALATYAIGKLSHRPAVTHVGGDLIRTQLLAAVLTHGLKFSVDRTRPNGGRYSFPSGHTSASVATAAVLGQHFGWKVAVPAYATAGFVGWTRVRDHVHYPSDVVFGATLGVIASQTVTRGHNAWRITPVRTAGGFAVYVTRTKANH